MAQSSWPAPSHSSGSVTDSEFEALATFNQVDGIVGLPSDTPLVFGDSSGRQIKVRANRFAQVRGRTWSSGSSEYTVSIGANVSGQTRTDLVVVGVDRTTYVVTLYVKAGTPGAGAPALQTDLSMTTGKYEIPIATVTVINGASTISAADVVFKGWFVGQPNVTCTSLTRPPAVNGLRIFETDTALTYVASGGSWLRLAQADESKRLIWGKRYTTPYLYANGFQQAEIARTAAIPLKAGRNYEIALDIMVYTGAPASVLPIWVASGIHDLSGNLTVDSGTQMLNLTGQYLRLNIAQVVPVSTNRTETWLGYVKRAAGNGTFDVLSGVSNHAAWFRVYDLGTLPLAA